MLSSVTVVTTTLGDSCTHLGRVLAELRQFTNLPFLQIVSDDGTLSADVRRRQREIVQSYPGASWTENPGPVYGVSYNLNHLFEQAKTPWVFLIEDAARPSQGWLETALDALEKIGRRTWQGRSVGAIGLSTAFEHWHLAAAGLLPGLSLTDCWGKHTHEAYRAFWEGVFHNDGLWCWQQMEPAVRRVSREPSSEEWPEPVRRTWRDPILKNETSRDIYAGTGIWHEVYGGSWPQVRRPYLNWRSCAWGLFNMEAWRKVGRWRDGCTVFEGHLGVRLAQHGYLTVNIDNPPWLHYPSLAFHAAARGEGRTPRHHEPCDGPEGILERDFGCNGPDHLDLVALVRRQFQPGQWEAIVEDLAPIELYMDPAWKVWS